MLFLIHDIKGTAGPGFALILNYLNNMIIITTSYFLNILGRTICQLNRANYANIFDNIAFCQYDRYRL